MSRQQVIEVFRRAIPLLKKLAQDPHDVIWIVSLQLLAEHGEEAFVVDALTQAIAGEDHERQKGAEIALPEFPAHIQEEVLARVRAQ